MFPFISGTHPSRIRRYNCRSICFQTVSAHKLAGVFSSPIGFKYCFIENSLHLMPQNSFGCCLIPINEVGETSRERESWLHVASSIDSEPPWPDNPHFNCHEAITMYPAMHPRPDRLVHLVAWRHGPGYDATYWSLQMYTPSIPCHSRPSSLTNQIPGLDHT